MERIKSIITFLLMFVPVWVVAQTNKFKSVTEYPVVDKQYVSSIATPKIKKVFIAPEGTLIHFEYIVPSNVTGPWLSMSSNTIMKTRLSTKKYRILDWGYVDENGNHNQMNFDEKYTVKTGVNYVFYMGFEALTSPTTNISIYEDGYNGFYWEGIHLNDQQSVDYVYCDSVSVDSSAVSSDEQQLLAKFIVTNAKYNGQDITQQIVNQGGAYTVIYSVGEETYMANYMEKQESQSWGKIYDLTSNKTEETSTSYEMDVFKFSWNYQNSYDSETGTCKCTLTKIYKPQGVVSVLKMVTEKLDVIEYTGYLDGSVDIDNL